MRALTPGDADDLLARYRRAREKRDVDEMLALYADTAELRLDPFAVPLPDAVAIRGHWNQIALTQLHVEFDVERSWVSGGTVLASWHSGHSMRESGERVRERGMSVFELDQEGLIIRQREWVIARPVGVDSTFRPEPVTEEAGRD